jgi:hypothetical protein
MGTFLIGLDRGSAIRRLKPAATHRWLLPGLDQETSKVNTSGSSLSFPNRKIVFQKAHSPFPTKPLSDDIINGFGFRIHSGE